MPEVRRRDAGARGLNVRLANGAADLAAALEVWRRSDAGRSPHGVAGDDANVRRTLSDPTTFVVLATDETGEAVGMAQGMDGREDEGRGAAIPGLLHVGMVFVVPERWSRGVGSLVLDALLDAARDRGYTSAQLWTGLGNQRARPFYEHRGWTWTGEEAANDKHDRIVRYVRDL